jgi:Predicted unusual protein kinase
MKRSLILNLLKSLNKIYFSSAANKEQKYKKVLFYTLKDMGGVYIKFLQTISTSELFMDDWGGPKEYEVFNKVPTENINIYKHFPNTNAFSYISPTPFASGSFAQVYKATLKNNKQVIIKVLRPSIVKNLKSDLRKLKMILRIISPFLPSKIIDFNKAFEEFKEACLLETDYERETSNIKYFYNLYKNNNYVVIPKVYEEYSNKYVIVQDFIGGITLSDLMTETINNELLADKVYKTLGSNIWTQMTIVGGEFLKMAITADYVFGDPHPGNIILLPDNKVALIDFGIIAHKPKSQKAFYLWTQSFYNVLQGKEDVSNLFIATGNCFCPDLFNAFSTQNYSNTSVQDIISKALSKKVDLINGNNNDAKSLLESGHVFKYFTRVLDKNNALNIKIDANNFQLLKAMQLYLGTLGTLDDKYGNNYFSEMLKNAMKYALDYSDKFGIKNDLIPDNKYSTNESYEIIIDFISSLANNDEFLFSNIYERMFK